MLISAVQQSDSVIHKHALFFIFFSIMVYHRIKKNFFIYLFWLHQVLAVACGIFSCGMQTS